MKQKSTVVIQSLLTMLALFAPFNSQLTTAFAQGTAFMYQGRLNDSASPADGAYDLTFTLFGTNATGVAIAGPLTNSGTGVTNGLFTVTLDFGPGIYTGTNYWMEVGVRTNGNGSFTTLAPRQSILPVPYAVFAPNAGNATYAASAGAATTAGSASVANAIGSVGAANVAQLNVPNTTVPATGTVTIVSGFVVAANLINGGSGYTSAPAVSVVDATGSNVVITAAISSNGAVTNLTVQSAGINYSSHAALNIAPPPSNAIQTFGSINNFTGVNTFSGTLNANNIYLPATTTNTGIIYSDGSPLLYGYQGALFAGYAAGNFALSSPATSFNVGLGDHALASVTTGYSDTAVGSQALQYDTTGYRNTGIGREALINDTTGYQNTGIGFDPLWHNTSGNENTAIGFEALNNNTTASYNTACGANALFANTTGTENAANGGWALYSNISGSYNTASGEDALHYNTTGSDNVAMGFQALYSNTNGNWNTASGVNALRYNTTGSFNLADGNSALNDNTSGSYNTASGFQALWNNTRGSNNIALGGQAGYNVTNGNNNIEIGNMGATNDNNIIRIGSGQVQAFIAGVITGDGGGLTNLNAAALNGQPASAFAPANGSANYIQNQNASPQSASLNISGNATIGGTFTGNGAGLTDLPANAIHGGLTTNLPVMVAGGTTNILCFTNGILMAIQ